MLTENCGRVMLVLGRRALGEQRGAQQRTIQELVGSVNPRAFSVLIDGRDRCYPTESIESASGHAFSVHFIHDFLYFVQLCQLAAPEPNRPVPDHRVLHEHAGH
jgi:hypothetical protein